MIRKIMLLLMMVLLSMPFTLDAAIYGTLRGKVTDKKSGDPVPAATIMIQGTKLGGYASNDGRFTIVNVDLANLCCPCNSSRIRAT